MHTPTHPPTLCARPSQDENRNCFGGLHTTEWKRTKGVQTYYGTLDSFVWRFDEQNFRRYGR